MSVFMIHMILGLLFVRPVAGHVAWACSDHYKQKKPDGLDWLWGVVCGLLAAATWPALLVLYAISKVSTAIMPTIGAEKRARQRLADERRKQLERDLEL